MPQSVHRMGGHFFRAGWIEARVLKEPHYIAELLFLFLIYIATALWGLSLHAINGFATLVWPPTGIALAALYLYGYRLWPAVFFGAFLTNLITGAPAGVALGIGLGNGLEALLGAYFLRDVLEINPLLRRLYDSLSFIGTAVAVPILAATIGVGSLTLGGIIPASAFAITWAAWWLGDVLGALILGAFLIRWLAKPYFYRTRAELIEGAAAFALLIGMDTLAVINPSSILSNIPMAYFFIPFLWLSIRGGARGITAASLITAIFVVWGAVAGGSLFANHSAVESLFLAQILIGLLSTIFLIIASAMEERRQSNLAMTQNVDELRKALGKIKRADQAKNEFLAVLAHELRNPLAPLLSSLELFKMQGFGTPEKHRLGEKMEHSIALMSKLLDDLLDVSRVSRKHFKLEKIPVDIGAVVRRSLESVETQTERRGHAVSVSLPQDILWVAADPLRLEQIVVNLLNNAAKYTPPRGTISISCRQLHKEAVVEVRDTGIGISAERLPHIFEPFQQGPGASGSPREGIGVGLSLTKKLVRLHGGVIEAASEGAGRGSTFTIRLPLSPTPLPASVGHRAREQRPEASSALKVLVVDDNTTAAQALGRLLEVTGYETRIAHTGKSALKTARDFDPHVAIVDIGLPDLDGYGVARQMRGRGFSGALIALTGYGQDEDKAKAFAAGFDHHLTKPAGIADIRAIFGKTVPAERHMV